MWQRLGSLPPRRTTGYPSDDGPRGPSIRGINRVGSQRNAQQRVDGIPDQGTRADSAAGCRVGGPLVYGRDRAASVEIVSKSLPDRRQCRSAHSRADCRISADRHGSGADCAGGGLVGGCGLTASRGLAAS
jgi:hypothetical protein